MIDFMDFELASAIFSQKKMALCYGACHLIALGALLNQSLSFFNEYRCFSYPNAIVIHCLVAFFGGYFPQNKRFYDFPNPYCIRVAGYYDTITFVYTDTYLNSCIDSGMKF